jgi:hypothetical protein
MANNSSFSALPRLDMRLTNDVKGLRVGRDWACFKCGTLGHFARDYPKLSKQDKAEQPTDQLGQLALAQQAQRLRDQPPKAAGRGSFMDCNRGGGPRATADTRRDTDMDTRRDSVVENRSDRQLCAFVFVCSCAHNWDSDHSKADLSAVGHLSDLSQWRPFSFCAPALGGMVRPWLLFFLGEMV